MTLLVQINPFPYQEGAQVGVFGTESLPFLLSRGLNIHSGPQIWCSKHITLYSKTRSPTSRLPFQKVQPVFTEGGENPQILTAPYTVGTFLMKFSFRACTFSIPSLIFYVRTLGLGKLAYAAKLLGWGSESGQLVSKAPCFSLHPIGQSPRFPSPLVLALSDRKNVLHA